MSRDKSRTPDSPATPDAPSQSKTGEPAGTSRDARASDKPLVLEELEARILLSTWTLQNPESDAAVEEQELSADEVARALSATENSAPLTFDDADALDGAAGADSPAADEIRREIVFIDEGVEDYDQLLNDLLGTADSGREFEVVLLSNARDGIEQISDFLNDYQDLDAIHIISHGSEGAAQLGNGWLSGDTLADYESQLAGWSAALSEDADLLFYGCDLAGGESGEALIGSIAKLTGADVAASSDLTGAAALGGDWDLEVQAGQVETELAFSSELQRTWSGTLATATFQEGVNSYTGTLDTEVYSGNPTTPLGSQTAIVTDTDNAGGFSQGLLQFADLFGSGPGQIPPGSTITSASLTLNVVDTTVDAKVIGLHQMLTSWDESSTWDSMSGGIQLDDNEAVATADATIPDTRISGAITINGLDSTVQSWANGDPNNGWAVITTTNDGWDFSSSESVTAALRPQLTIEYVAPAAPTYFVVTTTADSGPGSLRQAILDANATANSFAPDVITFDIGAEGSVQTINLLTALDPITEAVVIDGSSQYGTLAPGGPVIVLDGSNAGTGSGLILDLGSDGSTIRGLVINQFSGNGITLYNSHDHTIAGNYIGTDVTGTVDLGNALKGIQVENSSGNQIGGASAADRNVISGNQNDGIILWGSGSTLNVIQGNYLGVDATGHEALGNLGNGLSISGGAHDNTIGGDRLAGEGNVLSGNSGINSDGIGIDNVGADNNKIYGNYIGTNHDGTEAIANARHGVVIYDGVQGTLVGGTGTGQGNIISGNDASGIVIDGNGKASTSGNIISANLIGVDATGSGPLANTSPDTDNGIEIFGSASNNRIGGSGTAGNVIAWSGQNGVRISSGSDNAIVQNSIHSNTLLGIDLGASGVSWNGSGLQNYPVLTSVVTDGTQITVEGTLSSAANTSYRIELYANDTGDANGHGEGQTLIGIVDVTTDGAGNATFSEVLNESVASGSAISATVSSLDAGDAEVETSEFSQNFMATAEPNFAPSDLDITATSSGGLSINEDGGNDAYLIADNGGAIFGGLTEFSTEVRFSVETPPTSTYSDFISYATPSQDEEVWLAFQHMSGTSSHIELAINGVIVESSGYNANVLFDGEEHTLTATWSSTGGAYEVFVDGVSIFSGTGLKTGYTLAGGGELTTVRDQDLPGGGFDLGEVFRGKLHDLRIFDDIRSSAEIAGNFLDTLAYDEPGMVANWTFNDFSLDATTGSRIVTETVSGNNFTAMNVGAGGGYVTSTPELTLAVAENSADGTVVGTVSGTDGERQAQIADLLAADADLVYNAETEKFYKSVDSLGNWTYAWSEAQNTSLNGIDGQLVTIDSAAENEIIQGLAQGLGGPVWLGASDQGVGEGTWSWYAGGSAADPFWIGDSNGSAVDGAYQNWAVGQPDNGGGALNEDWAWISDTDGTWSDQNNNISGRFVVEWTADDVLDGTAATKEEPLVYSVQSQTVAGAFTIDADKGEISVADGSLIDFETELSHTVVVRVTDVGGLSYDEAFTIAVTDANDAPTALSLGITATGETQANTTTSWGQDDPEVAAMADGGYVVVWTSQFQDSDVQGVYGQRYDVNGAAVGAEFQINTTVAGGQYQPSVAGTSDGGFVATWVSGHDGTTGVYAQAFDSSGNSVGSEFHVPTMVADTQQTPHVTAFDGGGYIITWTSTGQDGWGTGIYAQRFDAAHNTVGLETLINTFTAYNQQTSQVTTFADDSYAIVWASWNQDGQANGVYGQRFNSDGSTNGAEFRANTTTLGSQFQPQIATLSSGGFVVSWFGAEDISAQVFDADGIKLGGELLVNTYAAGSQDYPSVTGLADGGFLIAWNSDLQDGDGDGVFAQRFSADGSEVGSEFRLSEVTAGAQQYGDLATLSDGRVVATWNSPDANYSGVYSKIFSFSSVNENAANGTMVDTVIVTDIDEGDTHTFVMTADSSGGAFQIDFSSGLVTVADGSLLDFETATSHALTVEVTDSGGLIYSQQLDIAIANVYEAPVITSNGGAATANINVAENTTAVTTVTATDPDLDNPTLSIDPASDDAAFFNIDPGTGVLTFAAAPDFETAADLDGDNVYEVIVQVSDSNGGVVTQAISVTVTNVDDVGINDAPINSVPSAQTIDHNGMLLFSSATGTAITTSDFDAGSNAIRVTLSATNGVFNLSGNQGLSFSTGDGTADGTMSFTGTVADINAALEGATFVTTPGFIGNASLQIVTNDLGNTGTGGALSDTDSVAITVRESDQQLWLTLQNDEGGTGNSEIPSITGGDIVTYSDITQLETSDTDPLASTTTGTLAYGFNLDTVLLSDGVTLASDGNTIVNAVHRVGSDLLVGTNNIQLYAGDLLLSTHTSDMIDGITYQKEDVFVFRPDTPGDYSQGSFFLLIDGKNDTGFGNVTGITLVEQTTIVGGVTLNAGEFLIAHSGEGKNILRFTPGTLGDTSSGTMSVLIAGSDIGVSASFAGLHLAQADTVIGGVSLTAGQLLVSLEVDDAAFADNLINVSRNDIVILDVTATGTGTTAATATRFFEGLDESLDNNNETIWGIGYQGNGAPTVNAETFAIDENSTNGTAIGTVTANDPENSTLTYAITAGNTAGGFAINSMTGEITVANSAALDFETTPSFNLTVAAIDDQGAYGTETVTVNLNDLVENTGPTTSGIADITIDENSGTGFTDLNAHFADAEDPDTALVYTIVGNTNPALFNGATIVSASTLELDYGADLNGTSYITIRATDTGGLFVESTFTVTVNPVNDAPVRTAGTVADLVVDEDSGFTSLGLGDLAYGPGGGGDEASQSLSYEVTGIPDSVSFGTVYLEDGTTPVTTSTYSLAQIQGMQFAPAADVNGGPSFFSFRITDSGGTPNGGADSVTETIELSITPVNDAPIITAPSTETVAEEAPLVFSAADGNPIEITAPDAGAGLLYLDVYATNGTVTLGSVTGLNSVNGDGSGHVTLSGDLASLNNALDGLTFVGTTDFDESTQIGVNVYYFAPPTYDYLDDSQTIDVTITSVNDAPVTAADVYSVLEDETLTVAAPGVLDNDTDPDSTDPSFEFSFGTTGSLDGEFANPNGMDFDSAGNVYVVDANNHRIQVFDSTGSQLFSFGLPGTGDGQFDRPTDVTVDSSGNIYVADNDNARIQKFSNTGTYLLSWGSSGTADGQFNKPVSIAVDSGDNIYVADALNNRVQKFDSLGNHLLSWGGYGIADGEFNTPVSIAIDARGVVWVGESGNDRVQQFDTSGNHLLSFGSGGSDIGELQTPGSIAFDQNGNAYIGDTFNQRVQVYDAAGNYLMDWGSYGTATGEFQYPQGVAIDSAGRVWVADGNNDRIQVFAAAETSGEPLTATLVTGPSHASIFSLNADGSFAYTPDADWNGTDSFVYEADDGNGGVTQETVTITVAAVNDAPLKTAGTITDLVVAEDSGLTSLGLAGLSYGPGGGADEASQSLTYEVTVVPDAIAFGKIYLADGTTQVSTGMYSLTDLQGMRFEPGADVNGGPSFFSFRVTDSGGTANGGVESITETIRLDITAVDDAAVIMGNTSYVGDEGDVVAGDLNATDAEGLTDATYFSVTSAATNGTAVIDAETGAWSFTPTDSNWFGTDSFEVSVTDDLGGTTTQLISITLANVDDSAVISGDISYLGNEGDAVTGTMTATDVEGLTDGTYFTVTTAAPHGVAAIDPASGAWTFTPTDVNWVGADSFTVTVTDDLGGTSTQVVNVWLGDIQTLTAHETGVSETELRSNANYGQTFFYNSGDGTYPTNRVSIELRRDASAISQSITLSLRETWNGPDLANSTMSSDDLGTSMAWHAFDLSTVNLNDGQSYIIRVTSDTTAGLIYTSYETPGTYPDGTALDAAGNPLAAYDGLFRLQYVDTPATITGDLSYAGNEGDTVAGTMAATDVDGLADGTYFTVTTAATHGVAAIDPSSGAWTFTPTDANWWGTDSFEVTVTDDYGGTTTQSVSITLASVNDAPVRTAGTVADLVVLEDSGLTSLGLGDLAYDTGGGSDEDGQSLSIEITILPSPEFFGKIFLADGTTQVTTGAYTLTQLQGMQFAPAADENGGPSFFNFRVYDDGGTANGGSDFVSESLQLTITAVNDDAVVTGDSGFNGDEGDVVAGDLNATDVDGLTDSTYFTVTAAATHGTAIIDAETGGWSFTPTDSDWFGSDSFEVTVTDDLGGTTTQLVSITLANVDDAAVITGNTLYDGDEGDLVAGDLNATDVEGLTDGTYFTVTTAATNGTAAIDAETGAWSFTPTDPNWFGTDSFEVTVTDDLSGTTTQLISITLANVNDAPIARSDPGSFSSLFQSESPLNYWRLGEMSGATAIDVGSSGVNGIYVGVTLGETGAIQGDSDSAARFDGTSYLEIPHSDDQLLDAGTVQLWFNPDASANGDLQHLFSKDSQDKDTGGHLSMYLNASGRLEVRLQSASADYIVTSSSSVSSGDWHHAAVSFGSNGMELYLDGALVGTDAYTGGLGTSSGGVGNYEPTVIGGGTQSSGDLVANPVDQFFTGLIDEVGLVGEQLDVATVQNLYAAGQQNYTLMEDGALVVPASDGVLINDTDVDGDSLTAILVTGPTNAQSFTLNADGSFDYTPTADFNGTDSFTYRANDGTTDSNLATVILTVTGVDDAAVITGNVSFDGDEGDVAAGDLNATDTEGLTDGTYFTVSSAATNGTAAINVQTGAWSFTPTDSNWFGTDSFEVTVTDDLGGTTTQLVSVTLANVDDAAVINGNTSYTGDEGDAVAGDLNAADIEGLTDTTYFSISSGAMRGTAVIDAETGAWSFTPTDPNWFGSDSFEVTVTDDLGGTTTQLMSITLANVDDAAVITGNTSYEGSEGDLVSGDLNATDVEGLTDTTYFTVSSAATNGTAVIDAETGAWSFTPTDSDWFGTDSFEVTVTDDLGGTSIQLINITLANVDDGAVITGNTLYDGNEGDTVAGDLNATDVDGLTDASYFTVTTAAANGTAVIDAETGAWSFTPTDANWFGSDSFEVTVTDDLGGTTTQLVSITLANVDDAAVITGNTLYDGDEGDAVAGDLNATDVDGLTDATYFTVSTAATNGTALIDAETGAWSFTPTDSNWFGTDSFEVTVTDDLGGTTAQLVSVTLANVDDAAVITGNTFYDGDEGDTVAGDLSATDVDGLTDGAYFTVSSAATNGTAVIDAETGSWSFTPTDSNWFGTDSFEVTVTDDLGGTTTQLVSVTLANVDDAAIITGNTLYDGDEGDTVAGDLNATDVEGLNDGTYFAVTTAATNGTAVIDAETGSWSFTPTDPNWFGTDSFEVTVTDDLGGTTTQLVSITLANVDDAAVITGNTLYDGDEGDTVAGDLNATDVDGLTDGTYFTVTTAATNGTAVIDAETGAWSFTPTDANWFGSDSFEVTVTDDLGGTTTQLVNVTLANVNDAAVITGNTSYDGDEGDTVAGDLNATDVEGLTDAAYFTVTTAATNGTAVIDAETGAWTFTPTDANWFGTDSFEVTVTDDLGGTTAQQVSITLANVDDAAVITGNTLYDGDEGDTVAGDLNATDVDGLTDTTYFSISSAATNGTAVIDAETGAWSFTPTDSDWFGTDSFEVTVTDDLGGTTTQLVSVTLANVDDAAVVTGNTLYDGIEGDSVAGDLNATDVDGLTDSTYFTVSSAATNGTAVIDAETGAWSYTPTDPNWFGTDSFEVTVTDDLGGTTTQLVSVTLANVDDGAVITGNTLFDGDEGDLVAGDLNATDVDGLTDATYFTITTGATNGTAVIDAETGAWSFTPTDSNWFGTDSFEVTVTDDLGGTTTQLMNITLANVDDGAVITGNTSYDGIEGDSVAGDLNATDVEGLTDSTYFTITTGATNGTAVIDAETGAWSFTPADANWFGIDSFEVTITDDLGGTTTQLVSITLASVNDAPTLDLDSDDSTTAGTGFGATFTMSGGPVSIVDSDGALADVDSDLVGLSVTITNLMDSGSEFLAADTTGTLIVANYDAGTGVLTLSGTDSAANYAQVLRTISYDNDSVPPDETARVIVFVADDGLDLSNIVESRIDFIVPNFAPVAEDDSALVAEGGSGVIDVAANDTDYEGTLDPGSVTIVSGPTRGTLVVHGDGTVQYTHDGSETLSDSFSYTIRDVDGAVSNAGSVVITVDARNDAPVASDDAYSVDEDMLLDVATADGVVANDLDVDGDTLSATLVSAPSNAASFALNADGSFSYMPAADFFGTDSFSYRVSDGSTTSGISLVNLTVVSRNDAPRLMSNLGTTFVTGASSLITSNELAVTDVDDAVGDLVFNISTPPSFGHLELVTNQGVPTTSFTQSDIDAGYLSYHLDDPSGTSDSFSFDVTDPSGTPMGLTSFSLSVYEAPARLNPSDIREDEKTPGKSPESEPAPAPAPEGLELIPESVEEPNAGPDSERIETPHFLIETRIEVVLQTSGMRFDSNEFALEMAPAQVLNLEQLRVEREVVMPSEVEMTVLDVENLAIAALEQSDADPTRSDSLRSTQVDVWVARSERVVMAAGLGAVVALLRTGSLLALTMSSVPLWKGLDPVAALLISDKRRERLADDAEFSQRIEDETDDVGRILDDDRSEDPVKNRVSK